MTAQCSTELQASPHYEAAESCMALTGSVLAGPVSVLALLIPLLHPLACNSEPTMIDHICVAGRHLQMSAGVEMQTL